MLGTNIENDDDLRSLVRNLRPHCIVNCIGIIKQLESVTDPLEVLPINSILPHRLVRLASEINARTIHISTDCVFSGTRGMYKEGDASDVNDLYGMSKFIGELKNYDNALTLRTSIIGHELDSKKSLVDWFLSRQGRVQGFDKAIFTGLPATELSCLIMKCIVQFPSLNGLYHAAADSISKYALLSLINDLYGRKLHIDRCSSLVINRSLDATKLNKAINYKAKPWGELLSEMKSKYERWGHKTS